MSLLQLWAGGGKRRKSDEQWDRLVEALSNTQRDLAAANGQIATLTAERDEARGNSDKHLHLWRCADREVKRLRFLLGEDAQLPVTHVPAPVDNGSRDLPVTTAATVRDASLTDMALPGDDTIILPTIPDRSPVPDPVTSEVEARLNIPAPSPLASATSVPITSALNAVSKVHASLGEAS